ncbi:hypothetical protein [Pseudonocardia sp. TMWB2A]|uniref:hypothetical protein n=1 Tax=Pseudonocardia sp. TMWB2A TaxID=687430 RepID=UPI00307D0C54
MPIDRRISPSGDNTMRTTVRSLLGAAVIAVGVTSGGSVYAAQTMAAPAPSPVGAGPEAVRSAVLLSAPPSLSTQSTPPAPRPRTPSPRRPWPQPDLGRRASPMPTPTSSTESSSNKDCPELIAAQEDAQREYATSEEAQYDWYINGPEAGQIAQENAPQSCREQTGMTTAECQADAADGNAS